MAEKKTAAKKANGKTLTVRQIKSANRKPEIQAATLRGLGLGKIRRERTLEDTPVGARHDPCGPASRRDRRRQVIGWPGSHARSWRC